MVPLLLSALIAVAPATIPAATSKIVAVTIASGGYGFVTREIEIPQGGAGEVDLLPSAIEGTVWFATSPNIKIDSVQTGPKVRKINSPFGDLSELLLANVGKTLTLKTADRTVSGKLLSMAGGFVILQTKDGSEIISTSSLQDVTGGNDMVYQKSVNQNEWGMDIHLSSHDPQKIYMIDLEKGIDWGAAYLLDVTHPKEADLTERAEIDNNIGDISNLEVHLVTGLPNVAYIWKMDGLFVSSNPAVPAPELQDQGFAGGMGGGGGRFMAKAAYSAENGLSVSPLAGKQMQDFYIYRVPGVTLLNNHKGYFVSLRKQVEATDSYTWDVSNPIPIVPSYANNFTLQTSYTSQPVWHEYQFKNTTGRPLSGGPIMVMSDDELLGQATLDHLAPDQTANVKLTIAPDIQAGTTQTELSRKQSTKQTTDGRNVTNYDLSTVKTTLTVINYTNREIHIKITTPFVGEVKESAGGQVNYVFNASNGVNRSGTIVWDVPIAPKQKLSETYTSDIYVAR